MVDLVDVQQRLNMLTSICKACINHRGKNYRGMYNDNKIEVEKEKTTKNCFFFYLTARKMLLLRRQTLE